MLICSFCKWIVYVIMLSKCVTLFWLFTMTLDTNGVSVTNDNVYGLEYFCSGNNYLHTVSIFFSEPRLLLLIHRRNLNAVALGGDSFSSWSSASPID